MNIQTIFMFCFLQIGVYRQVTNAIHNTVDWSLMLYYSTEAPFLHFQDRNAIPDIDGQRYMPSELLSCGHSVTL